ncbi:MAG: rhomboid family intramembrane serine protease [Flavobacteriales bacterium CG_4_9_14_3_um_filter_40_17]|nr:MAG: rhomboid family intramembrane serine protease [Flavobacteriales bacterium CG_4_9_14_3_um_filter_40_17]
MIYAYILIALNILVSSKGFNDYSFFEKYKFNIASVRGGEQIRILSSGFLHVDWAHLLFNMLTFYFFVDVINRILGEWQMAVIYFVSLVVGNLLTLALHKNESNYSAVGASGAVTGILYAAILLQPGMSLNLLFIPIPIPAYLFGICYLLYSIYGMKQRTDNIGHSAHFGGAIGGYAMALFFAPGLIQQNLLMVILLAIPIVILFVMHKTGKL